ncbi:dachshund 1, partial [Biomphalaria glabrata]
LDFLRAHASMSSLPLTANGLDGTSALSLSLQSRDLSHLSPSKGSPPHNRSSPRPGSASTTPNSLSAPSLSAGLNALNLIQTPKSGLKPSSYSSPPPLACNPEHNVCKLIDYRGAQVAAFMVESRELICLPQAFELFLKHLVGGLHTVYTKLKRLEITPIVCNVEQVRILRGLGAIQPGVNRCKLISCSEFDTLYDDCTNSNSVHGTTYHHDNLTPHNLDKSYDKRRPSIYIFKSLYKYLFVRRTPGPASQAMEALPLISLGFDCFFRD